MSKQYTRVSQLTDATIYINIYSYTSAGLSPRTGLAVGGTVPTIRVGRWKEDSAAVVLVAQTITGAHTDHGFVETSTPGRYRYDFADAAVADIGPSVWVDVLESVGDDIAACTVEVDIELHRFARASMSKQATDVVSLSALSYRAADDSNEAIKDSFVAGAGGAGVLVGELDADSLTSIGAAVVAAAGTDFRRPGR